MLYAFLPHIAVDRFYSVRRLFSKGQEQALREELVEMRRSVDQYAAKEQHIPTSLDELVSRKYIKIIPVDPFTGSSFSWILERDEHGGIVDIHSSSQRLGSNGKPYREW